MGKRVPIPIPLNGLNTVNPDLPLEAGYARELTNYSLLNGRLRMRPAVKNWGQVTLSLITPSLILWYDEDYVIDILSNIKRISDSVTVGTITSPFNKFPMPTIVKHVSLELVMGVAEPRLPNYPFTSWTFTTIGITPKDIEAGCSYKGRLYVTDGTVIEYSSVGQITGGMLGSFDASEFMDGQSIIRIFSNTIGSGNNSADNVFVIFGDGGKVLVYSGDYPASSTWNLQANYDMSAPMSQDSFVEIDGDIFVAAKRYAYWFTNLISQGALEAQINSPSLPIENLWQAQEFVGAVAAPRNSACYLPNIDAIMVNFGGFDPSYLIAGYIAPYPIAPVPISRGCLVYFRKYKSWSLWLMNPFDAPIRLMGTPATGDDYLYGIKNQIVTGLLAAKLYRIKYTENSSADTDLNVVGADVETDICTSWKTPYINAFGGNVQKVTGFRPFYQSSLNGYLFLARVIFDYTDYNAPYGFYTQPNAPAQINPGNYAEGSIDMETQSWDNYNPFGNVPGVGGGVSLQISQKRKTGSVNTQLNEIYAATIYLTDGGEMI